MPLTGDATPADIRERLLALLAAHGIPNDAVHQRTLNRATDAITSALYEAFIAGENHAVEDTNPPQAAPGK